MHLTCIINAVQVLTGNVRNHGSVGNALGHSINNPQTFSSFAWCLYALGDTFFKVMKEGISHSFLNMHQCDANVEGTGKLKWVYVPATFA